MFFRSLSILLISGTVLVAEPRVLRVCADPNNLPFSNQAGEGFENRLAEVMARDLGARLEYTWWSERPSFIKNSLNEGKCDAILGVPSALDSVLVTRPYYRSSYVFVSRHDRNLNVSSLLDERFANWKIGVHVVGNDYAPPASILARQGLVANIKGYSLFGEYGQTNPPARLINAVAKGDVDVAIAWGPLAGYFANKSEVALDLRPVSPAMYLTTPFVYDISAAVRKDDESLKNELDDVLWHECAAVYAILQEFHVPLIQEEQTTCEFSRSSSRSLH